MIKRGRRREVTVPFAYPASSRIEGGPPASATA